jgi:single-strand DNA-binding protein
MAKDLNKVMLTGYLGADPEMRYTPQGSAVTTFRVASGRSWKSADGTPHEETEWFRVVAWDKLGEICNQYLTKGTRVYVEGRLRTNKWQDKETGQDRYSTEVIASDMIILSSRQDRSAPAGDYEAPIEEEAAPPRRQASSPAPARAANGNAAPRPAPSRAPARNVPQTIDNDEDLPF